MLALKRFLTTQAFRPCLRPNAHYFRNMLYQPFWCEENIWHLTTDPEVGPGARWVAILTGISGHFACWGQRAASPAEAPVLWDYHVVLMVQDRTWQVWDFDTLPGCPLPAVTWLKTSFPQPERIRQAYQPRCLLIPAALYHEQLLSDRSHMRTASGGWQHPPPPWPAPQATPGTSLATYIERAREGLTYAEIAARLS